MPTIEARRSRYKLVIAPYLHRHQRHEAVIVLWVDQRRLDSKTIQEHVLEDEARGPSMARTDDLSIEADHPLHQ